MVKFIFDLDGTVTREETLPIIADKYLIKDEIEKLTLETVAGRIPFVESFIRRVFILGKLPVNEIDVLVEGVPLYPKLLEFIQEHKDKCCIATGNLNCWTKRLAERIGCQCFCSEGKVVNNHVEKLTYILKKEMIVKQFQSEGNRVVFVGDGNNDVEAMRLADVSIASGLTHAPALGAISVADYLVLSEESLCRQLNQLL